MLRVPCCHGGTATLILGERASCLCSTAPLHFADLATPALSPTSHQTADQRCKLAWLAAGSLVALTDLNISNNCLTTLKGLGYLPNLFKLDASLNKLSTLHGLEGNTSLRYGCRACVCRMRVFVQAALRCARFSRAHDVGDCRTALPRILNVAVNNLESLAGLQHLKALGELLARKNKITNALPLSHMNDLFSIDLSANNVGTPPPPLAPTRLRAPKSLLRGVVHAGTPCSLPCLLASVWLAGWLAGSLTTHAWTVSWSVVGWLGLAAPDRLTH